MNKLLISIFSIWCFLSVINAVPQKCTQVINYFDVLDDQFNGSMISTFTISKNVEDKTFVSITDMSLSSLNPDTKFEKICIFQDFFLGVPICVSNYSETLKFEINNSTFFLQATVNLNGQRNDIGITYGLIDEGSISFMTGEMYNDDKKCITFRVNNTFGFTNVTQCCTSLEPIPDASINTPQCINFKSRTAVYNIDDNYSIFFTSKINYTKLGSNLVAHGDLTGQTNDFVMYGMNGFYTYEVYQTTVDNLTFPISYGDSKVLLQMEALNTTERFSPMLLVGRIIYRNGQTLMEEGIPFTKENDCQYFNRMYSKNQVATTSFCCTEFEDSEVSIKKENMFVKDLKNPSNHSKKFA